MENKEFQTAVVDDRVYHITEGWGRITGIDYTLIFPIKVNFDNGILSTYTLDGKAYKQSLYSSIYWDVPTEIVKGRIIVPPKPRWRAKYNCPYYFINSCGNINFGYEDPQVGSQRFNKGNYFKTEEEAKNSDIYNVFNRD